MEPAKAKTPPVADWRGKHVTRGENTGQVIRILPGGKVRVRWETGQAEDLDPAELAVR